MMQQQKSQEFFHKRKNSIGRISKINKTGVTSGDEKEERNNLQQN